jgi:leucyl/phenylalanyl-tRNA--protein transferase
LSTLTPDDLIYGYINGIFPMSDATNQLYWYSPDPRAIIPLKSYKVQKSLRPIINKKVFEVRYNTDFEQVMRLCSQPRKDDPDTWISEEIINAYTNLHKLGMAYSVETYIDNRLVGGLYGVSIGAAFFGESMFHLVPNASKVAFHYLVQTLKRNDYRLLDTQFINDNVKRFGAIEISKAAYLLRLKVALSKKAKFIKADFDHIFS